MLYKNLLLLYIFRCIAILYIMSLLEEYQYDLELTPDDPQADQSGKIILPLKPHQRAALHKALIMEKYGKLNYNVINSFLPRQTLYGEFTIKSNVGIIGDMVGYGKTLTALSIVANNDCNDIFVNKEIIHTSYNKHSAFFSGFMDRDTSQLYNNSIKTTLAIVPRGPVYVQWQNTIQTHTKLKGLFIDGISYIRKHLPPHNAEFNVIREFFEKYDIVLVKNTTFKLLFEYYCNNRHRQAIISWDRILIDEAHEILNKIPLINFKFAWLISASYQYITNTYGTRGTIGYTIMSILTPERVNLLLIKGQRQFVMQSFNIPEPIEHIYLCKQMNYITAVQPFLTQQVQERLNANDIQGAIREMGGSNETEDNIIELVTREIKRDIHNKEREIDYIKSLDIPDDQKEHRINTHTIELNRLNDKYTSLKDRVSALSEKTCAICYDTYNSPIMIQCTHVFCGMCLINWMRTNAESCPECRSPILSKNLIGIVSQKNDNNNIQDIHQIFSKEDTLIEIIKSKEDGKFLIFSRIDSGFFNLINKLNANHITFGEMKGTTGHMMNVLEQFKQGQIKVILLNTYYAGSGIDISFATDVVIFHSMGLDRMQAIGRAQRQGRTSQLHIHTLMYPHEIESDIIMDQ